MKSPVNERGRASRGWKGSDGAQVHEMERYSRQYGRVEELLWPVSGDVGCAASRAELHAENESSATNKETGHG
jgi:hypothetical protein